MPHTNLLSDDDDAEYDTTTTVIVNVIFWVMMLSFATGVAFMTIRIKRGKEEEFMKFFGGLFSRTFAKADDLRTVDEQCAEIFGSNKKFNAKSVESFLEFIRQVKKQFSPFSISRIEYVDKNNTKIPVMVWIERETASGILIENIAYEQNLAVPDAFTKRLFANDAKITVKVPPNLQESLNASLAGARKLGYVGNPTVVAMP